MSKSPKAVDKETKRKTYYIYGRRIAPANLRLSLFIHPSGPSRFIFRYSLVAGGKND
jgi:hypothetical protein